MTNAPVLMPMPNGGHAALFTWPVLCRRCRIKRCWFIHVAGRDTVCFVCHESGEHIKEL